MIKKKQSTEPDEIELANELFGNENELRLSDLNEETFLKLIIHCLAQCIEDKDGNPPHFTRSNNFVFLEIEDLRYTIEIRNNKKYI